MKHIKRPSISEGKEKKIRTAPTNTSLLPPCKVCQEPAAGFHYGVNTCEACKGFFRRSLIRSEEYKCIGNGNCDILVGKRKICPKCRHLKCLAVGMSKDAIKTGRYTHAKRTQDILEAKKTEGSSSKSVTRTSFCFPSNSGHCSLDNSLTSVTPSPYATVNDISSEFGSQTTCPYSHTGTSLYHPTEQSDLAMTSSVIEGNVFYNLCEERGRMDETVSPLSNCSTSPLSNGLSQASSFSHTSTAVEQSPLSVSPSSTFVASSSSSLSPPASPLAAEEELQQIVNHLVEAHDKYIITNGNFTKEELLEKQKDCFDRCKLKQEMFGSLGPVSEEEYHDIFTHTGLDIDGRQPIVAMFSQLLDESVRRYIAFMKAIPGFSQLSIEDQIKLIKDNRCEFATVSNYYGYNQELQVVTLHSGLSLCIHDMDRIGQKELALTRFQCAKAIEKLGLTHEEIILFKSLIVVTVGNEDVDEPEKVSAIQWKLAQCLLWLLKQNRPDPNLTFARIISTFYSIRLLSAGIYDWLKTKPFNNYPAFKDNAFLMEWFSNG